MEHLLYLLLVLAALGLLVLVLALGRRRERPERRRVGSKLGVSAARREEWQRLGAHTPLGAGRHVEEAEFSPRDLAEIERMLASAQAQELSAQDGRMLGVLEGLSERRIRLVDVNGSSDEAVLVFADGTQLVLEGVGLDRLQKLRRASKGQVGLLEVSYNSPSVLLSFSTGRSTLLLGAAKAWLA